MISGDFSDRKIFKMLVDEALKYKVEIVMATPPCQGMSTAGQQKNDDERNDLIIPTVEFIQKIQPKYVFIENVPQFLKTKIKHKGKEILIPDFIQNQLGGAYDIEFNIADSQYYSVPQTRERAILLMTHKNNSKKWQMPNKHKKLVVLEDVIGNLPSLDPFVKDVSAIEMEKLFPDFEKKKEKALAISMWHNPPHHVKRQVIAMMHTPTGKSAFNNEKFKPVKESGELIKGFPNTYKRQNWNRPAYTITMDNVKISSQNNVHPGKKNGKSKDGIDLYSDARALTLYELMLLMSLPKNWPVPENASEAFLRRIIGEGIPPLMVKHIFENLK
jgi:DNA (cytosine-5)-methyltransferase 1